MRVKLYTAPTLEPITLAELRTHCNIDSSNAEPSPEAPTVALAGAGAGNVTSGAHRYRVTFVTADGETDGGVVSAIVTTTAGDGKVSVSAIPLGGSAVTSRKLYRTAAGGSTYLLLTTIADNTTTTYADNVADGSLGAGCPTTNTTIDPFLTTLITTAREHVEDITRRAVLTQTWDYYLDDWPDGEAITLPFGNLASVTSLKWTDDDGVETNMTKMLTAFAASDVSPATKTKVTSAAHGFSENDLAFILGTTSYNGIWTITNVTTNTFDITTVFVANDATGTASTDYIVETNGEGHGRIVLPDDVTWPTEPLYPSNPIVIRFVCGWTTRALVPYRIKAAIKLLCADMYRGRGDAVIGQTVVENQTVDRLLASMRLWGNFA